MVYGVYSYVKGLVFGIFKGVSELICKCGVIQFHNF